MALFSLLNNNKSLISSNILRLFSNRTKSDADKRDKPISTPRYLDLEPSDLLSNPNSSLYLPGSEYRSHRRVDNDLPAFDDYLTPMRKEIKVPMELGVKPLTHGRVICFSRRAKVTKTNKVVSYAALVIGGNGNGVAGYGYGRGNTPDSAMIDGIFVINIFYFIFS